MKLSIDLSTLRKNNTKCVIEDLQGYHGTVTGFVSSVNTTEGYEISFHVKKEKFSVFIMDRELVISKPLCCLKIEKDKIFIQQ